MERGRGHVPLGPGEHGPFRRLALHPSLPPAAHPPRLPLPPAQVLHVHPSSVLFTRQPSTGWVVYHEVMQTTKSFIRDLTVVEKDWFTELACVPVSSPSSP